MLSFSNQHICDNYRLTMEMIQVQNIKVPSYLDALLICFPNLVTNNMVLCQLLSPHFIYDIPLSSIIMSLLLQTCIWIEGFIVLRKVWVGGSILKNKEEE